MLHDVLGEFCNTVVTVTWGCVCRFGFVDFTLGLVVVDLVLLFVCCVICILLSC